MTELVAAAPAPYPLPDWAKEELSDLKGNQKSDLVDGDEPEPVRAAYDRARGEVLDLQRSAGLDRLGEGGLRWDDMLAHPLAVHDAVETRGIVRYYDNNNFYREPVVTGELTPSGDLAEDLEAAADNVDGRPTATVPGPYSLSRLATDEQYGDEAEFLAAVADFLAGEVAAFPEVETLFVLEPSLVADSPGDGPDRRAAEAVDRVVSAAADDVETVVYTYTGGLEEKVHAHLLDAGADAFGYDLIEGRDQTVYNVTEYGTPDDLALGVVDGANTLIESGEDVVDRVDWFRDQVPAQTFDRVYALPSTPPVFLPYSKFEAKLRALGAASDQYERDADATTGEVEA